MFRTEGYVPTCYSPVCRSPCGALDLHVLGLPPAFALSQDQTLKLDEIDSGRSHVLTRSTTPTDRAFGLAPKSSKEPVRCTLNVDRQVSSMTAPQKGCPFRGGGPQGLRRPRFSFFRFTCQTARRSWRSPSPVDRRAAEAQVPDQGRTTGHTISEELQRRAIAPIADGAPSDRGYMGDTRLLSTDKIPENKHPRFLRDRSI